MHADDLADAAVFLLRRPTEHSLVNVGVGQDISIQELAELIREVVGFEGQIRFDASKPDGTPRKLLDVTRLFAMGWRPRIKFRSGIASTYDWYAKQNAT
jgi:GDP-L-fucose synthase